MDKFETFIDEIFKEQESKQKFGCVDLQKMATLHNYNSVIVTP